MLAYYRYLDSVIDAVNVQFRHAELYRYNTMLGKGWQDEWKRRQSA